MPEVDVESFEWDDGNTAHCAAHGVWPEDLEDALFSGEYVVVRNRKTGTAPYLFIGRDRSGRCVAAPIVQATETGVWRPISAWPCKPAEEARLR
jgi:uncharacterized DUF497 family protein